MKKQIADGSAADATETAIIAAGTTALDAPIDFAADAGDGVEFGMQDLQVPYLVILQSNSPQTKDDNAKYVDGAEESMILNTATQEIYKGRLKPKNDDGAPAGIDVVPCMYARKWVEWLPDRGGFVAQHAENTPLQNEFEVKEVDGKKVNVLPNGNILVDTAYFFVLVLGEETSWAVIALSSSGWKPAKQWSGMIDAMKKKGAMYSCSYRLSIERNSKNGNDWWNWKIVSNGFLTSGSTYRDAQAFRKVLVSGVVKAATPDAGGDAQEPVEGNGSAVPF